MKYVFCLLAVFMLSGCWGYVPKYYDKEQEIFVHGDFDDNIHIYVDDKELKTDKKIEKYSDCGKNIANCDNIKERKKLSFKIPRSSSDKQISIVQNGVEVEKVQLIAELTDEKWAQGIMYEVSQNAGKKKSAAVLLLPTNTYYGLEEIITDIPRMNGDNAMVLMAIIVCLPVSLATDIYNIVIGFPSTAVVNPWFEYSLQPENH